MSAKRRSIWKPPPGLDPDLQGCWKEELKDRLKESSAVGWVKERISRYGGLEKMDSDALESVMIGDPPRFRSNADRREYIRRQLVRFERYEARELYRDMKRNPMKYMPVDRQWLETEVEPCLKRLHDLHGHLRTHLEDMKDFRRYGKDNDMLWSRQSDLIKWLGRVFDVLERWPNLEEEETKWMKQRPKPE